MKLKTRFFNFFRKIFLVPLAERWLVKRTKGAEISHFFSKIPPNHYQYRKNSWRQVVRNGANYRLDLSDFVQWRTFWGIKDAGKDRLLSQLHAEDVFLDVGANIGEICLAAAKRLGEKGRVLAFEPIQVNFGKLQENLSLNPELQARTELFPFALGEKDREEVAFIHPRKDNQGMMRVQGMGNEAEVYAKVKMRSLDSLLAEKGLKRIDFIKIDVEGYELKVLKGGRESLLEYRPHLFIELDDNNLKAQGDSAKALVAWLQDLGYESQDAVSGRSLTASQSFDGCHFDIIARFEPFNQNLGRRT